ncbi:hypothetical protein GCM10010174_52460 [Kutzneria viridogrisea]
MQGESATHSGQARLAVNNAHSRRNIGTAERSSDRFRPVKSSAVPENRDKHMSSNTVAGSPVDAVNPARLAAVNATP